MNIKFKQKYKLLIYNTMVDLKTFVVYHAYNDNWNYNHYHMWRYKNNSEPSLKSQYFMSDDW